MPRKSKLTKALIKKAEKLLAQGNYVSVVCQSIGIDDATWYRWLREGEQDKGGLKCEFCDKVNRAAPKAETRAVEHWQRKFKDDWRAAKTFLAIRYPERWGEIDPVAFAKWHEHLKQRGGNQEEGDGVRGEEAEEDKEK